MEGRAKHPEGRLSDPRDDFLTEKNACDIWAFGFADMGESKDLILEMLETLDSDNSYAKLQKSRRPYWRFCREKIYWTHPRLVPASL